MKHADRITKISMRVEFKCAGRIAWLDFDVEHTEIVLASLRAAIDEQMAKTIAQHETVLRNHVKI